ncbi:MAG TPA: hypothetical protein VFK41_07710 [Nocardioidaceae bacterium]|nr:hypothetical protein [Nocardioidaceae bacterium]
MSAPPSDVAGRLIRKWIPLSVASLLLVRFTVAASAPLADPDVWWHLRLGRQFQGDWSLHDPGQLSPFATVSWVPTQWLPELVSIEAYDRFGLPGVAWIFGLGLVALVLTLYFVCRQRADVLPSTVAVGLALAAASASLSPRPQILSFALLALTVGAWLTFENGGRTPWWLIPLTWVWAMCHGMWFTGVLVSAAAVLATLLSGTLPRRKVAAAALVPATGIVVAALTPAGPRLLLAPFAVGERRTMILEWQPPGWNDAELWLALAMAALLALLFVKHRPSWLELGLTLLALAWAFLSLRTVALAGVMLAPLLAARIQLLLDDRPRVSRSERWVLGGTALACLSVLALVTPKTADTPSDVPLALESQLSALPDGTPVLNTWTLGGWLEWRHENLAPVVDGLAEAYTVEHLRGYIRMLGVRPGWEEYVEETGASTALLTADDFELAEALVSQLGWRQVGEDDGTVLLVAP